MCYCPTPTLHLNLALTGDGAFLFSLKKTHSVWFISVLNYGDTENVLINHLLLVIPMSYPCHYTNLCPHKPHKHAHTHTQWSTVQKKTILNNVSCSAHTTTYREWNIYCTYLWSVWQPWGWRKKRKRGKKSRSSLVLPCRWSVSMQFDLVLDWI